MNIWLLCLGVCASGLLFAAADPQGAIDAEIEAANPIARAGLAFKGSGTYGRFYDAGGGVGAKVCAFDIDGEGECLATIKEIAVLNYLDHRNIVKPLGAAVVQWPDGKEYLEMYVPYLAEIPVELDANQYMKDVARALKYVHRKSMAHRDIKNQNLRFNARTGEVVVIDFGSASLCTAHSDKRNFTTEVFRAPEHFFGDRSNEGKLDVWSLGMAVMHHAFRYDFQDAYCYKGPADQLLRNLNRWGTPQGGVFQTLKRCKENQCYQYFSESKNRAVHLGDTQFKRHDLREWLPPKQPEFYEAIDRVMETTVEHRLTSQELYELLENLEQKADSLPTSVNIESKEAFAEEESPLYNEHDLDWRQHVFARQPKIKNADRIYAFSIFKKLMNLYQEHLDERVFMSCVTLFDRVLFQARPFERDEVQPLALAVFQLGAALYDEAFVSQELLAVAFEKGFVGKRVAITDHRKRVKYILRLLNYRLIYDDALRVYDMHHPSISSGQRKKVVRTMIEMLLFEPIVSDRVILRQLREVSYL